MRTIMIKSREIAVLQGYKPQSLGKMIPQRSIVINKTHLRLEGVFLSIRVRQFD